MGSTPHAPEPQELTTDEAADLLNVRPRHVLREIEAGVLPVHVVDGEPRLWSTDVHTYRDRAAARREAALQAMTNEAEDLGLYDE